MTLAVIMGGCELELVFVLPDQRVFGRLVR